MDERLFMGGEPENTGKPKYGGGGDGRGRGEKKQALHSCSRGRKKSPLLALITGAASVFKDIPIMFSKH